MVKLYQFTDGDQLTLLNDSPKEWRAEILHVMQNIKLGYFEQGYNTISARDALAVIMQSDLTIIIGDTWIGGFSVEQPWHLLDKFLLEEFFGARPGKHLDLADFVYAGETLGKQEGCRFFEFGTRSNSRHIPLAKLAGRFGANITTITLQKEIE